MLSEQNLWKDWKKDFNTNLYLDVFENLTINRRRNTVIIITDSN